MWREECFCNTVTICRPGLLTGEPILSRKGIRGITQVIEEWTLSNQCQAHSFSSAVGQLCNMVIITQSSRTSIHPWLLTMTDVPWGRNPVIKPVVCHQTCPGQPLHGTHHTQPNTTEDKISYQNYFLIFYCMAVFYSILYFRIICFKSVLWVAHDPRMATN